MLLWITSCFEEINLIWVSAWSYPNRTPYIIKPKGPRYTKLTAHSHLNPTRTGLCYNNHQVDLIEACQSRGFRGKLTQLRKKTQATQVQFFTSENFEKIVPNGLYMTSNPSDVKSNSIYSRSEKLSNHTQSQDNNRSTPLAGLPSTSASVYSRRRCSKAFWVLPTTEEGGITCYYELPLVLKK